MPASFIPDPVDGVAVPRHFIRANIAEIKTVDGRTFQNRTGKVFFNNLKDLFENNVWPVEIGVYLDPCYPTTKIKFIPSDNMKTVRFGFTAQQGIVLEDSVMTEDGKRVFTAPNDLIDPENPYIPIQVQTVNGIRGTLWLESFSQLKAEELVVDTGKGVEIVKREDIRIPSPPKFVDQSIINYRDQLIWKEGITYGEGQNIVIAKDGRILVLPDEQIAKKLETISVQTPGMQKGYVEYKSLQEFGAEEIAAIVYGQPKICKTEALTLTVPAHFHPVFYQAPGCDVETFYTDQPFAAIRKLDLGKEFLAINAQGHLESLSNCGLRGRKEDFLKKFQVTTRNGVKGSVLCYHINELWKDELFVMFPHNVRYVKRDALTFKKPRGQEIMIEIASQWIKGITDLVIDDSHPDSITCIAHNGEVIHGKFVKVI